MLILKNFVESFAFIFVEFLQRFDTLDQNNDGRLAIDESGFSGSPSLFHMLDSNNDSFITPAEIRAHIAYLQIKLDSLQHNSTQGSVVANETSSNSEVSTNKTESVTIEATSTVITTNDSQVVTEEVTSTTEPVDTSSDTVSLATPLAVSPTSVTSSDTVSLVTPLAVSPTSVPSSTSVTATPTTDDEIMAELQGLIGRK